MQVLLAVAPVYLAEVAAILGSTGQAHFSREAVGPLGARSISYARR